MTAVQVSGAGRVPARAAGPPADEVVTACSWHQRARAWLRAKSCALYVRAKARLAAAAGSAIDGGIAALQRLRRHAGGTDPADERPERERARSGRRTAGARAPVEAGAGPGVAVHKPRRRLRGLLVHLGMLLLGAMGGMALSYDLLERLLERRAVELKRQDAKLSKYAKSAARLQAQVEQAQLKRAEAETRLAAAQAEDARKLGELEAKRADLGARLAAALAARASAVPPRQERAGGRGAARITQTARTKSVDCTLGASNVRSALKGCIADMGRK